MLPIVTGQCTEPIHILLINPDPTPGTTASCLRSISGTIGPHITVHGFTAPPLNKIPTDKGGKEEAEDDDDEDEDQEHSTAAAPDAAASACFQAVQALISREEGRGKAPFRFDAFLVASFSGDYPLVSMLRAAYPQPAVGMMEAALYAARMCGAAHLGVVTTTCDPRDGARLRAEAEAAYGLGRYFAPGSSSGRDSDSDDNCGYDSVDVSSLRLDSDESREQVAADLARAVERLVRDDPAVDCVLLGCPRLSEIREACCEAVELGERDVMVVDGVAMGVHFLTALVREGLENGRGAPPAAKGGVGVATGGGGGSDGDVGAAVAAEAAADSNAAAGRTLEIDDEVD